MCSISSFGISFGLDKSKSDVVAVEFDTFKDAKYEDLNENHVGIETCFIYLWRFKLRQVPNWMHAQPLDPKAIAKNTKPLTTAHKSSNCLWKVLSVFIFGGACGASTASCVLYLWTIVGDRRPVVFDN
ncbi:hypothetical protein CRYUN_Cryun02cG0215800 [Craigia yunnanensis]